MVKIFLVLLLVAVPLAYGQASAQRFLVPIVAQEQPGAYGSIWTSTLSVYNAGDETIVLYPAPTCAPGICVNETPVESRREALVPLYRFPPDAPPGRVLYVYEDDTPTLFFHSRVRDMSRAAQSMGVQIPIIPEADLFRDEIALLAVPGDTRFRHTLRIYDINNQPSQFRIRVFSGTQLIHEEAITLFVNTVDVSLEREEVIGPSAAQLDYGDRIPDEDHLYRITIEPLQESLFWAFLSITNNETQEVTLVLPNSNQSGS